MFKFTIREMLLATALVGTGIGWWIDHRAHAEAAEFGVHSGRNLGVHLPEGEKVYTWRPLDMSEVEMLDCEAWTQAPNPHEP